MSNAVLRQKRRTELNEKLAGERVALGQWEARLTAAESDPEGELERQKASDPTNHHSTPEAYIDHLRVNVGSYRAMIRHSLDDLADLSR